MEGTKFKFISAGDNHSLGIDESGNLYAWGRNYEGQLGDGTTSMRRTPTLIMEGTKFKYISSGYYHSLAIDENGNLYTWGYNEYGQQGDGTTTDILIPTLIMSGIKFKSVSVGYSSWNTLNESHILALDESGNLYAWGSNNSGQLGDGTYERRLSPKLIINSNCFNSISLGEFYNLALNEFGNLFVWGYNESGGLGSDSDLSPTLINNYFP